MRKLFLFFIACAFAQAQQKPAQPAQAVKPAQATAIPFCRLGADPADSTRKPDWATECVVKVSEAMPVVMTTGSGRQAKCLLTPLTPVVIDRATGKAKWVLACGNPIVSPVNWVPAGIRICGPEPAQQTAAPAPATPQASPVPAEMRVSGEVRVVHEGEVRLVHSGEIRHVHEPQPSLVPVQAPAPTPQPKKGWWSRNWRWVVPFAVAAGAGAAVALTRGGQKTIQYQPLPPPLYRP